MVIPDCQVRDGVNTDYLEWVGNYAEAKRPDVLINIGDFADMPSLSSYAVGKAEYEGKRYNTDIRAAQTGMARLLRPLKHKPERMILTLGNHEERIDREAENNPKWKGSVSSADLGYEKAGWKVYPFLAVANVDGIEYSHYFVSGALGRPVSSAAALLRIRQSSAVMGHVQRIDLAVHPQTQYIGLFSGICYLHDEVYLTPQGNNTKRGIWLLHEVHNGTFDPMFVSLDFLKRKYS
jgi:hypothetical protein